MNEKNPYQQETPEWQLYENMISAEALARSHAADAERYQRKSAEAREKAERFKSALDKLLAEPSKGEQK